jgi:hypothetical protein
MNELTPIQIDKIKNTAKEIDMLSREQDLVFKNLSTDLKIDQEHEAYHWLFDLCYNGESIDFDFYIQKINKLL